MCENRNIPYELSELPTDSMRNKYFGVSKKELDWGLSNLHV